MAEVYYESELVDIFTLLKNNNLAKYGITSNQLTIVDATHKANRIKESLQNYESHNPLLNYKAYLLFESLFVFDLITQYNSFIIEGVPIPLYMFKRGSNELQQYYYSDDFLKDNMKLEYYHHIQKDKDYIPSQSGELAELEHFFKHLRTVYDIDVIDDQLKTIGLSYNKLVSLILLDNWRNHPQVNKWNKTYSPEDWINHAVL